MLKVIPVTTWTEKINLKHSLSILIHHNFSQNPILTAGASQYSQVPPFFLATILTELYKTPLLPVAKAIILT